MRRVECIQWKEYSMFRILLVEDDPEISGVLERQLTAWN